MTTGSQIFGGRQNLYGQTIGILCTETYFPKIPGHIKNATTFNFPVVYKVVKGATIDKVVNTEIDRGLLDAFINGARELEKDGARAITGSCGFLALYQRKLAQSVQIPVYMSSLIQVPMASQMIGKNRIVGIITADSTKLTTKHLEAVGISGIQLAIAGMERKQEFTAAIYKETKHSLDIIKFQTEVLEAAQDLLITNPNVGAIVLECTDLPPFAAAIQESTQLPVFDIVTLTNMVYDVVVRRRYTGIFPQKA